MEKKLKKLEDLVKKLTLRRQGSGRPRIPCSTRTSACCWRRGRPRRRRLRRRLSRGRGAVCFVFVGVEVENMCKASENEEAAGRAGGTKREAEEPSQLTALSAPRGLSLIPPPAAPAAAAKAALPERGLVATSLLPPAEANAAAAESEAGGPWRLCCCCSEVEYC